MMPFYVDSQASNGEVGLPQVASSTTTSMTSWSRIDTLAKPLVGVYLNGPVEGVEGVGFSGHGLRDAYGAVSLDDGVSWKNTNLSESALRVLVQSGPPDDIPLFADLDGAYPGDVTNIFHAVAGNKVLVAWPSRFCASGQPQLLPGQPTNRTRTRSRVGRPSRPTSEST